MTVYLLAEKVWCIHMKTIMSYCYYPEQALTNTEMGHLIQHLGLQGIEQLIYKTESNDRSFADQTVGVHLKYWPYWMDFLLGKKAKTLEEQFPQKEELDMYYGGCTIDAWEKSIRENIRTALKGKSGICCMACGEFEQQGSLFLSVQLYGQASAQRSGGRI